MRLRFTGLLILLAGAVGLLVRGRTALIPSSRITALFRSFGLWFRQRRMKYGIRIQINPQPDLPSGEGMRQLLPYTENGTDLTGIIEALTRFAPAVLVFLVILFLLAPLLSKKSRVFLARHSLKDFIREIIAHFRMLLGKKDGPEDDGILFDRDNLHEVRKQLAELGLSRRDRARRKEFGRVSRSFLRLIRWGKHHGIVFTAVSAPGSYTQKLSQRIPAHAEKLATIADCFEQAVYSPLPLGKERLAEYENAVRTVIREKQGRSKKIEAQRATAGDAQRREPPASERIAGRCYAVNLAYSVFPTIPS